MHPVIALPASLLILAITLSNHAFAFQKDPANSKEKAATSLNGLANVSEGRKIFDGSSMAGWEGNPELWRVEEGSLTGETHADKPIQNNTFLVWKEGVVGDFELHLEYRIQGGNSGIQYRSKLLDAEKWIVGGYQADIDANQRYTGINYEERGRGILADRGQIMRLMAEGDKRLVGTCGDSQALADLVKQGEWNRYRIVAKGNLLQHYINDILMSEVLDEQTNQSTQEGILAFQLHQGPAMKVQFKNIVLH